MADLLNCPFCGEAPRRLAYKGGFYTERVICDSCDFHLAPEAWSRRASVPASTHLTQEADGWLHEDGLRICTAEQKRTMEQYQGLPGKRTAPGYSIALYRAPALHITPAAEQKDDTPGVRGCARCDGDGSLLNHPSLIEPTRECPDCKGTGIAGVTPCGEGRKP